MSSRATIKLKRPEPGQGTSTFYATDVWLTGPWVTATGVFHRKKALRKFSWPMDNVLSIAWENQIKKENATTKD